MSLSRVLAVLLTLVAAGPLFAQNAAFSALGLAWSFGKETPEVQVDQTGPCTRAFCVDEPNRAYGAIGSGSSQLYNQHAAHYISVPMLAEQCLHRWREAWVQGDYEAAHRFVSMAAQLDPKNQQAQGALSKTLQVVKSLSQKLAIDPSCRQAVDGADFLVFLERVIAALGHEVKPVCAETQSTSAKPSCDSSTIATFFEQFCPVQSKCGEAVCPVTAGSCGVAAKKTALTCSYHTTPVQTASCPCVAQTACPCIAQTACPCVAQTACKCVAQTACPCSKPKAKATANACGCAQAVACGCVKQCPCVAPKKASCGCGAKCECCKCGARTAMLMDFVHPTPMMPPMHREMKVYLHPMEIPHMHHGHVVGMSLHGQLPHVMPLPHPVPMPPVAVPLMPPTSYATPPVMPQPLPMPADMVRTVSSASPLHATKSATSHAVHLVTPKFEARCHHLSSTGVPDQIILEGDVHLTVHHTGQTVHLHAQRIVVHVKTGVFSVDGLTVPIPHHNEVSVMCPGSVDVKHAVHFTTPCQQRMPRDCNRVGRGHVPKVEDFDPKPRW
ncbi:MAG: hypothetical protein L0215_10920 [Gemmataceae bacterium]|nr:hypothetical protein [Gemmataceae bacterium]